MIKMIPDKIRQIIRFDFDQPGYAEWPIPSGIDKDIMTVIDWYQQADTALRFEFETVLTRRARKLLIIFAQRMASLAVRDKSDHYIFYGLIALAIDNHGYDRRYSQRAFELLHYVAWQISADASSLFKRCSAYACNPAKTTLEVMSDDTQPASIVGDFREIQRPDGIFYSAIW